MGGATSTARVLSISVNLCENSGDPFPDTTGLDIGFAF
jgi:hypothetical protein